MEMNDSLNQNSSHVETQDDLLDDLMNIVQTDLTENLNKSPEVDKNNAKTETSKDQELNRTDNEARESDDLDENSEYEDDLDEENNEFIDQMLEKPIDILEEKDQCNFYTYDKIQIKNIYWRGCQDTILPENWVQVTHACGMPLFLNRTTRVCTLSRPYYINESSARKHDIPISSIPCMAYKRRKETVEAQIKEHNLLKAEAQVTCKSIKFPVIKDLNKTKDTEKMSGKELSTYDLTQENQMNNNEGSTVVLKVDGNKKLDDKKVVVTIQTNEEKSKENKLTPDQVHEYCKKLFEFDVVKVKKFKTWSDRKTFIRKSKQKNTPKFPENSKMLKIQTKTQKGIKKELNINMTNKSALSILYEYASQVHKSNPRFEIIEKENPKDPFHAICYIDDKISGKGTGNSKKSAKTSAAEAALTILIPDFKSQATTDYEKASDDTSTFFDSYPIEHSHIYIHSQKLGSPLPYDVLLTCLKYNFAINMSRNQKQFIEEDIKPIKYRNCQYRMKLGQYDVEVNCVKKKEGRQFAAQKILQQMHPHLTTWGSILRLYGTKTNENFLNPDSKGDGSMNSDVKNKETEKGKNQEEVFMKAKPNKELLEKLKDEMRKLKRVTNNKCLVNSNNTATNELDTVSLLKNTLLTIPPLKLDNELESMSYLKSSESIKSPKNFMDTKQEDGKIMFNVEVPAVKTQSEIENSSKKRKKYSDNESNEDDFMDKTEEEEEDGELHDTSNDLSN